MLPPGLGLNAISEKALAAGRRARLPRSYWSWPPMLTAAETGLFPYTPATNLLFGLREALAMFDEEGMPAVLSRHARHAEATRRAVRGWGLDTVCQNPDDYSSTLTAVMLPNGFDADQVRRLVAWTATTCARCRARAGHRRPGVPASAIWEISVTSPWPGPCAGWKWGWPGREYRSLAKASARRSITSGQPPDWRCSRAVLAAVKKWMKSG